VKQRLLVEGEQPQSLSSEILDRWQSLFTAFHKARSNANAPAPGSLQIVVELRANTALMHASPHLQLKYWVQGSPLPGEV
jgi:hypothetical protein